MTVAFAVHRRRAFAGRLLELNPTLLSLDIADNLVHHAHCHHPAHLADGLLARFWWRCDWWLQFTTELAKPLGDALGKNKALLAINISSTVRPSPEPYPRLPRPRAMRRWPLRCAGGYEQGILDAAPIAAGLLLNTYDPAPPARARSVAPDKAEEGTRMARQTCHARMPRSGAVESALAWRNLAGRSSS